jgi:DNA repair exonuclease SbcCD nuclease subunit
MRFLFAALLAAAALPTIAAQSPQDWFFAVLSDPQLGMYAKDRNFAQEQANLEFVVANLNRLHPRFVIVCGDLVNRTGDEAEIAAYKRILKELDPSIPVYNVAGNHDVGNVPTPATLEAYRSSFGRDYYTFTEGTIFGVVLDSSLLGSPQQAEDEARRQEEWLRKTLADATGTSGRQIVVFQHIPYFLHDPTEAAQYFNIAPPIRRSYLDLLEKSGVGYVFAGHYHHNAIGSDGPLTEIVTGAVGMPLGHSLSGFRLVGVRGSTLTSTWYCFGGIPNQFDPQSPAPTPCPQ